MYLSQYYKQSIIIVTLIICLYNFVNEVFNHLCYYSRWEVPALAYTTHVVVWPSDNQYREPRLKCVWVE